MALMYKNTDITAKFSDFSSRNAGNKAVLILHCLGQGM